MHRIASICVPIFLLTGCASSIGAFFHRPVVQDQVGTVGTLSQSADRRTVLVMTGGPNDGKFCAEPPPDSAVGLKTELDASLKKAAALDLSLADKLNTSVTVIAERTAALDMFRTGTYALCQFRLAGQMDAQQMSVHFTQLIEGFVKVETAAAAARAASK